MSNSIFKSFSYLILSILLTNLILFFIGGIYSFNILYHTFIYTVRELIFFIVLLSQLLYIVISKEITASRAVIITLIFWIVFSLILKFVPNIDYTTLTRDIKTELSIKRDYIAPSIDILSMEFINNLKNRFIDWEKISINLLSSLILFLFHISILTYIKSKLNNNTLVKSLIFILFIFFILYLWNFYLNLPLLALSFIFFNLKGIGIENN